MTLDTQQVILDELREFRNQVQPWMMQTAERLSSLEAKVAGLTGTSDDLSSVQSLQARLTALDRKWNRLAGGGAVIIFLVGVIFHYGLH